MLVVEQGRACYYYYHYYDYYYCCCRLPRSSRAMTSKAARWRP